MRFLIWLTNDCPDISEIVDALKAGGHDIGILLAQDGVYSIDRGCATSSDIKELGVPVFGIKHHVEERGLIERLAVEAKLVEYDGAVDLIMERYDRVISL
ncbi:MAG: DsrH/TusB family sulfur metabolism protein [Candidatus Thorarchaeota archaeon]